MKFKKMVSGLLACALVVTSVFTGNVTTVKAADAAPSPMASYKFNVSSDDAQPSLGEGVEALTLGSASAATVEADAYVEGRSGIAGDKAINLNGKFGLRLPQKNIGANYTVSMWVKRTDDMANNFLPILWLGSEAGGYIAAAGAWHAGAPETTTGESIVWGGGLDGAEEPHFTLAKNQWEMLTIAQSGNALSVYQNGKLVKNITKNGLLEALNGADRQIYIGVNPYPADGLFPGVIDDVYVYNQKLTGDQVFDLYMKDVSLGTLGALGQNESAGCIKDNLTLPESFRGVDLTWTSQDTDKIGNDGTVKAWDGSEVTLTMKAALSENSNWSKNFTVRLAKKVTVEYVEKGKETLNTATAYFKAADSYTYELTAGDKVWTDEKTKKIYVCLEGESTLQTDNNTAKITLVYTEDAVENVVTTIPAKITRIGLIPEFPETVKATFTSGAERDVKVVWDNEAIATACKTAGKKTITGGVGAKSVTVQLTVEDKKDYLIADYSFDETDITGGWADSKGGANAVKDGTGNIAVVPGLKGNAIELPGGKKGTAAVKLADELLQDASGKCADDFTVSIFIKNPGNGNSFAMSLLGDGTDNYLGFINRTGGNGNTVQLECKKTSAISGGCAAGGQAKKDVWEHFAIVVNSTEGTTEIYRNGVSLTTGSIAFTPSSMKQQRNFLGRAEWGDDDFKGIYDEFKVYKTVLEPSEIKDLCDEVFYTEQVNKAKAALQKLTTWDGKKVDTDNVVDDLKLPLEVEGEGASVIWSSSNEEVINTTVTPGDGIVTQPYGDDAEDAEVTLTATIKIKNYTKTDTVEHKVKVPKREGADKKPLRHAVSAAQDYYDAARRSNAYVSVDTLDEAIKEANTALGTVMTDDEVTQMIAKLAQAKKLTPKSLAQLQNQKLLAAWYKLDADAKDASGNGADGVVSKDTEGKDTVAFSKEKGATFNGGSALKNVITLPADKLNVTDQMTFSFWAYDDAKGVTGDGLVNAFGIGSGKAVRYDEAAKPANGAQHFYVNTGKGNGLSAWVSKSTWNAHRGIGGAEFSAEAWHLVTCVLDGKNITLYIDKEWKGTAETQVSMTELWNATPTEQYAYIGNCIYGANGDKDYKGSIRDVRIYNAALAQQQIDSIYEYGKAITVEYAKADVVEAMKDLGLNPAEKPDGSYDMDIMQTNLDEDGKLAIPSTAYGEATVTWAATGEGADAIDTTTNVVTIPAAGTYKAFTLTATITVNDITGASSQGTLVYNCRAYYKNENLNTKPLTDLYNKLAAYPAEDYTSVSYAEFQATLKEVYDAIPLLQTTEQVNDQMEILDTAEGKLVKISGLRSKIETLENELGSLNENSYSEASWDALKAKLAAAKIVLAKADASKDDISDEIAKLPAKAIDDLKVCGSKKPLEDAIAEAGRLAAYKEAYSNWSTVEEAVKTAEAELGKRLESYEAAATALNNVINALVIKDDHKVTGTVKDTLEKKLADAKAENLVKDNYTKTTWDNYQAALDRLESVLGNQKATKDEAEEAAEALETARAELTTISSKTPTATDKQKLADAVADAGDIATADYTADSVAAYTAAKEKLIALSDRVAAGDNAVTTDEINAAVEGLATAKAGLVPTDAQKLTDDDKTALAQAVTDAKALDLKYYTADSKKAYEDALADLEALSKKNNATKNEVKAAEEALAKAKAGLTLTEDQIPTAEKKQEFVDAYKAETDRDLKAADYTEESWARYQAALAAAADLSERLSQANNKVAKGEIDAVVAELKAAYEALESTTPITPPAPDTDKTALDTAIKAAEKLVKKTYTTSTWNAFQTALTNAKNIYAKEDATQTEIDDAVKTLKAKQNALKKAVTKITITEKVTGSKALKIAAGKKVTLKAAVAPAGASSSVTWSVDAKSKSYASVNKNGVVTTKKAGAGKKATIIAKAKDGSNKTGKITITLMKNAVTKVTLKAAKKSVKAGKSVNIKATVKTNGKKANKTLFWKSSNTKFATVNAKGKVTTKKAGAGKTVTITATATDGTGKKASVKIKITK